MVDLPNECATPSPSRLFCIEPPGLDTPYLASLSSYLILLAEEHSLCVYDLVKEIIQPHLNQAYRGNRVQSTLQPLTSRWWIQLSTTINSLNELTSVWVHALSELTCCRKLSYLTILPWKNVLPYRGLIKPTKGVCPQCYDQWREADEWIYDPLIWQILGVDVCIHHHRYLLHRCPFCNHDLRSVSPTALNGCCHNCHNWLGDSRLDYAHEIPDERWQEQQWIVQALGEMLEAAPKLTKAPLKGSISSSVARFIEEELYGNASELADQLGMHHRTIYDWRDGKQLPQISSLLKLCALMGTTPLRLFMYDGSSGAAGRIELVHLPLIKRSPHKFNKERNETF